MHSRILGGTFKLFSNTGVGRFKNTSFRYTNSEILQLIIRYSYTCWKANMHLRLVNGYTLIGDVRFSLSRENWILPNQLLSVPYSFLREVLCEYRWKDWCAFHGFCCSRNLSSVLFLTVWYSFHLEKNIKKKIQSTPIHIKTLLFIRNSVSEKPALKSFMINAVLPS